MGNAYCTYRQLLSLISRTSDTTDLNSPLSHALRLNLARLMLAERKRIASLLKDHNLALPAIAAHSSLLEVDSGYTCEKHVATQRWC